MSNRIDTNHNDSTKEVGAQAVLNPTQIASEHGIVSVNRRLCETCGSEWTSVQVKSGIQKKKIDFNKGIIFGFQVGVHHYCCVGCAELSPLTIVQERVASWHENRGRGRRP